MRTTEQTDSPGHDHTAHYRQPLVSSPSESDTETVIIDGLTKESPVYEDPLPVPGILDMDYAHASMSAPTPPTSQETLPAYGIYPRSNNRWEIREYVNDIRHQNIMLRYRLEQTERRLRHYKSRYENDTHFYYLRSKRLERKLQLLESRISRYGRQEHPSPTTRQPKQRRSRSDSNHRDHTA